MKFLEPRQTTATRLGVAGIRFFGFPRKPVMVEDTVLVGGEWNPLFKCQDVHYLFASVTFIKHTNDSWELLIYKFHLKNSDCHSTTNPIHTFHIATHAFPHFPRWSTHPTQTSRRTWRAWRSSSSWPGSSRICARTWPPGRSSRPSQTSSSLPTFPSTRCVNCTTSSAIGGQLASTINNPHCR